MKRKFIKAFFEAIPLFAGLFVITAKPAPHDLNEYLSRYLCFIALFVVWNIFRIVTTNLLSKEPQKKPGTFYTVAMIGALATLFIGAILVFNHRFERISYEMALVLIGVSAFANRFKQRGIYILYWGLLCVYHTGVGYLSFQMVEFSWQWQAAVFAFAVATAPAALAIADVAETRPLQQAELLRKLTSMTLVLGPVWLALLVFTSHLSNFYLAPMLYLPIASRVTSMESPRIFTVSAALSFLLILCLSILGFNA